MKFAADSAFQKCIHPDCGQTFSIDEIHVECPTCGSLLDVTYDWYRVPVPRTLREFDAKWAKRDDPLSGSGVWRFHELLPFAPARSVISIGEGQTILRSSEPVADFVGIERGRLHLQYEGLNPSGSFKDNGMTAAFTHATMVGARTAACASTGNTSASLALYCAATRKMKGVIFIGSGKIAFGKLSQALDHGVRTLQIDGDFDDAMRRVQEVAKTRGIYLVNSVNPFRLEGQKTIMFRILEALRWEVPDWIVVPGGNLGNCSAFGKAFHELKLLGLIDRIPRLAVINASGASTFFELVENRQLTWNEGRPDRGIIERHYAKLDASGRKANTLASAIEINRPVNLIKALRALALCDGVVRQVSDQEIVTAKAVVGVGGFGCEPASAASVAGAKLLRTQGIIAPSDRVVCILTGHALKDPDITVAYHSARADLFEKHLSARGVNETQFANPPVAVANDLEAILAALETP